MKIHLILLCVTLGLMTSCSKKTASTSSSAHNLAASDFQSFIANPGTINIVDFSASWCGPCRQLKPVLVSVVNEQSDHVKLGIVDIDKAQSLASRLGVRGIPDVRFYINGKEVEKFTGAPPRQYIEQRIEYLLKKHEQDLKSPPENITATEPTDSPAPGIHAVIPSPPAKPVEPTKTKAKPSAPSPPPPAAPEETIKPIDENPLPPGMSRG